MNELSTLTIEQLRQGREETFSEEMLRDIDAELARREAVAGAEAQHTPGPWRVDYLTVDGWDRWSVLSDVARKQIGTIFTSAEDAALIARAPELDRNNRELARLLNIAHDSWDELYAESKRRGAEVMLLTARVEVLERQLNNIATAFDAFFKSDDRAEAMRRLKAAINDGWWEANSEAAIAAAKEAQNAE